MFGGDIRRGRLRSHHIHKVGKELRQRSCLHGSGPGISYRTIDGQKEPDEDKFDEMGGSIPHWRSVPLALPVHSTWHSLHAHMQSRQEIDISPSLSNLSNRESVGEKVTACVYLNVAKVSTCATPLSDRKNTTEQHVYIRSKLYPCWQLIYAGGPDIPIHWYKKRCLPLIRLAFDWRAKHMHLIPSVTYGNFFFGWSFINSRLPWFLIHHPKYKILFF